MPAPDAQPRTLYDKIWDAGGLIDPAARERWQKVATEEVTSAVKEATNADNSRSETSTPPVVVVAENVKAATASQQTTTEVAMRPAAVKV